MLCAPIPENENERLAALHESGLLDSEAERGFDDIVKLASEYFKKPIALITLIEEQRQWFKAKVGTELCETTRADSFCGHVIVHDELMVVPDARMDDRFSDNPFVEGQPHIRFYAGAPIYHPGGFVLGTLCLIDDKPGELDAKQRGVLKSLADQVGDLIALRIAIRESCKYQTELEHQRNNLESEVRKRVRQVVKTREEVVHCLARAAEYRDDDTGHHILRVSLYVREICDALGMDKPMCEVISLASTLHDVGKIGVPDDVLLKPGELTKEEYRDMQKHTLYGLKIIQNLNDPGCDIVRQHCEIGRNIIGEPDYELLQVASRIAATHHERFDGKGYPCGLSGERIPIEGRIVAVADVFDALSSKRTYKPPFPYDQCREILEEGRGSHFDPVILDAFLSRYDAIKQIHAQWTDRDQARSAPAA